MRTALGRLLQIAFIITVTSSLHSLRTLTAEEEEKEVVQPPLSVAAANSIVEATQVAATATAEINFSQLALQEALAKQRELASGKPEARPSPWAPNEHEAPPEPYFPPALYSPKGHAVPLAPMAASPPSNTPIAPKIKFFSSLQLISSGANVYGGPHLVRITAANRH